ncbi:acyltransferase family protein [Vibrio splendidus]|uniref:acyltransferase family protein n=1 Tax=Vibrio splendidus TaxID=29497 RepID=UPI000769ED56|nr:acyltransferase [Vibrio splendidus]PHX05718.1 Acyltransferase family protein [Vibrio splendidus]
MKDRFEVLDSFRGLCAISVVIYHMNVFGTVTELDFFRGSYLFVEFFFVLSGFVLSHGYLNRKDVGFKEFFIGRLFRLYPLHIFTLSLVLLFQIIKVIALNFNVSFEAEPFTGPYNIAQLLPNILLLQSWSFITIPTSFNAPAWSISVEFYMYFIFFLLVCLFGRRSIVLSTVLSMIFFIFIIGEFEFSTPNVARGISCFFGGVLFYYFYELIKDLHLEVHRILATIVEFLLLLAIYFSVSSDFNFVGPISSLLFMISVLVFSFELGAISSFFKLKFFKLMGLLSFSIYLTHCVVINYIGAMIKLISKVVGGEFYFTLNDVNYIDFGGLLYNYIYIFSILALTFIFSIFTYNFVEIKSVRYGKRVIHNIKGHEH